jgi:peptide-methionine (S)-S-oxide reductase
MSAIFYHDEEQKKMAEMTKELVAKKKNRPVTTQILPAGEFTIAEDYHQKYIVQRHPWLLESCGVDPGDDLIQSHVAARLNGYIGGYGKLSDFQIEAVKLGLNEKMIEYVAKAMKHKY